MARFIAAAGKFASDEAGATIVEYALMLALIAVVCIAAVGLLGTKTSDMFSTFAGSV
jgi:pilus assembly protein Flp/PilA